MEMLAIGLQRSCSLAGALSLDMRMGTTAARSMGLRCGTRWRSWPTSTNPRCFTTWQIWCARTPKRHCGLYSISHGSLILTNSTLRQWRHMSHILRLQSNMCQWHILWRATTCINVIEACWAASQRIANNHHAFCAWPRCWCHCGHSLVPVNALLFGLPIHFSGAFTLQCAEHCQEVVQFARWSGGLELQSGVPPHEHLHSLA